MRTTVWCELFYILLVRVWERASFWVLIDPTLPCYFWELEVTSKLALSGNQSDRLKSMCFYGPACGKQLRGMNGTISEKTGVPGPWYTRVIGLVLWREEFWYRLR